MFAARTWWPETLGWPRNRTEPRSALDIEGPSGQSGWMIFGAHFIVFSSDADADRAFLGEVFGFDHVDAGGGWLIFGLPPAELAVHPAENAAAELYLMCDDLATEMRTLSERGIHCSAVEEARWGSVTKIRLPGGGEVGLYQPRHATMVEAG
ncbi:MAG: hypothetical protein QOH53_2129 [Ilumatobacteraceae bacterium]